MAWWESDRCAEQELPQIYPSAATMKSPEYVGLYNHASMIALLAGVIIAEVESAKDKTTE
jgi:hypothetical protein